MAMRRCSLSILAALLTAPLYLSGCGADQRGAANSGEVAVAIKWPEGEADSRYIPRASHSIVVSLTAAGGGAPVAQVTIPRPQKTARLTLVPPGTYRLDARAYPATDGSGTAQAFGTVSQVVVVAGETTSAPALTMGTTVTSLRLDTAGMIHLGHPSRASVDALDAAGNTVLTPCCVWRWRANPSDMVTFDSVYYSPNEMDLWAHELGDATLTVTFEEDAANPVTATTILRCRLWLPDPPTLIVNLLPDAVVQAGATWGLDPSCGKPSGFEMNNPAGGPIVTVYFSDVPGYITPDPLQVDLWLDLITTVDVTYLPAPTTAAASRKSAPQARDGTQ